MYISVGQYKQCIPAEERERARKEISEMETSQTFKAKKGIKGAHENELKECSFESDLLLKP